MSRNTKKVMKERMLPIRIMMKQTKEAVNAGMDPGGAQMEPPLADAGLTSFSSIQ